MSFNEAQKRAIEFNKGPCLVIAGPGSGKTFTLTNRIKNLINNHDVSPQNILVITFNKSAAIQIKERFYKENNNQGIGVFFATFHSLFFTILKHANNLTNDAVITLNLQRSIIRKEILKYELEYDNEDELIDLVLAEISKIKNDNLDINNYKSKTIPEQTFKNIFRVYEFEKKRRGILDFDDFALKLVYLLKENEELRQSLIKRFKYILIDEFQDINKVQFEVIMQLLGEECNLFVVGDDDQSIYGFRGSKPEIMLSFLDIFSKASKFELNINYRSESNIVELANKLIAHNKVRFEKNLHTLERSKGIITYLRPKDQKEEREFLVSEIVKLREQGINYRDIAIFSRTNELNKVFVRELMAMGIKCKNDFKMSSFYNSNVVEEVLAYLEIALGDRTREKFLKIINKPMRYITRSYLTSPVSLISLKEIYEKAERPNYTVIKNIDSLIFDINMLKKMTSFAAINYIRKGIGLEDYIEEYARKNKANKELILEDLEKITELSKEFTKISDFVAFVRDRQKENGEAAADGTGVSAGVKDKDCSNFDGINFYTLHRSKGLEFKVVFIMDVCEEIIPLNKATLEEEIEEERRLFYVGITRAKKHLYILSPKHRYNKDYLPSRFIEEIGLEENQLL